jgi:two-component system chemotaxis response regulator CheB
VHGPKENLHRPSIDTLFRSAARWAGPHVIGVVLTGARDDGTVGMRAIKLRGGITIVQDPFEASFASMPMSVMQNIKVDYSIPLREIGPLLDRLSRETADDEGGYPVPEEVDIAALISGQQLDAEELIASVERIGKVSKLTCPDCHGALWEIRDDGMLRYRCHVGHAYSAESLSEGQTQMLKWPCGPLFAHSKSRWSWHNASSSARVGRIRLAPSRLSRNERKRQNEIAGSFAGYCSETTRPLLPSL